MYSEADDKASNARTAKKQASRKALLQATMGLIDRGGMVAVTHRAVAAEAGASPALVTYHFATIEGLLAATREYAISVGADKLAAVIERVRTGDLGIVDATAAYLSNVILNRPEEFIVALEFDLSTARMGHTATDRHHARDAYIALIRPFVADEDTAKRIFSAIFGYAFHGLLGMHSGAIADCSAFLVDLFERYDVQIVSPKHKEHTR